jgi:hypothetical protein
MTIVVPNNLSHRSLFLFVDLTVETNRWLKPYSVDKIWHFFLSWRRNSRKSTTFDLIRRQERTGVEESPIERIEAVHPLGSVNQSARGAACESSQSLSLSVSDQRWAWIYRVQKIERQQCTCKGQLGARGSSTRAYTAQGALGVCVCVPLSLWLTLVWYIDFCHTARP